jgi:HD-like signal output (HDOD) protein
VLENWGFAEEMCEAVANQCDCERTRKREAELSDILIVGIVLGEALRMPAPRVVDIEDIAAFLTIGLLDQDCADILTHAEQQLGSLQDALGC